MIRIGVSVICLLSLCVVCAQELTIKGTLSGFDEGAQVVLRDLESMEVVGATELLNNEFSVSRFETIDFPRTIHLSIGGETERRSDVFLFVENGENIVIHSQFENFDDNLRVENSKYYAVQQDFNSLTKELSDKRNELMQEYMQNYYGKPVDESVSESYWGKDGSIGKIDSEVDNINKTYLLENANNYFSLSHIVRSFTRIEKPVLSEMYEKLDENLRVSKYGVFLKAYIDSPQMEEGMEYADFNFENKNGKKQKLSDYFDGRYLLVDFSTLYCGTSQMSRPGLEKLSNKNKEKINVLTYYIDQDEEGFRNYIVNGVNNWNIIRNSDGRMNDALAQYVISGTPTYFLFNPEGVLIKKWSGYGAGTVGEIEGLIK